MSTYLCHYCDFNAHNYTLLMKHERNCHENDPNYQVSCRLCERTYSKWDSFKKHLLRSRHGQLDTLQDVNISSATSDDNIADNDLSSIEDEYAERSGVQPPNKRRRSALYLLNCTQSMSLGHSDVDKLCSSSQWLMDQSLSYLKSRIIDKLENHGISEVVKKDVEDICVNVGDNIFEGLHSRYMREKFYEEEFNYVKPSCAIMGEDWEWGIEGGIRKLINVKSFGYYVSLLSSLKVMLSNSMIRDEVLRPHFSSNELMADLCDGQFFHQHPIFSQYPNALQFVLYYDDIEPANALGSRAGDHKLGCFYYTLANIRPAFRSSLKTINVIAVAKTVDIKKYGCEALLKDFIEDVNKLSSENGYSIECLDGSVMNVHGGVLCFLGDVPASNYVGGFKEGVGFALRKCRLCLATQEDIKEKFHASCFISRNWESHEEHLQLIEADSRSDNRHSTTYGVNSRSILSRFVGFDVTKCMPYDIMHVIFEGVAPYHLQFLLSYLIDQKSFLSLAQLNDIIKSFGYGYSEKDTKPSPIFFKESKFIVKQSASQMMTLVRLLPFMIGDFVDKDDDHWACFLVLCTIVRLVLMFQVSADDALYLAWVVELYLDSFHSLYPNVSITPKMHYLIHLPHQIYLFGPLRQQWCMRFESKNGQLKSFIDRCYKNVPLTVLTYHQQWLCYQLATEAGFLYARDQIISASLCDLDEYKNYFQNLFGCDDDSPFVGSKSSSVVIHGIMYRIGCVVLVQINNVLKYCVLKSILIYNGHKLFNGVFLNILSYDEHTNSYTVEISNEELLFRFNDLYTHEISHIREKNGHKYLLDKFYNNI